MATSISDLLGILSALAAAEGPATPEMQVRIARLSPEEQKITERFITLKQGAARKDFDIQQLNEKLAGTNRLKDEFLANMGHELRTPLTSIIGFARLLIDFKGMEEEERLSYMRIILERAQSLETLLDNLLDLSRIESGTLPLSVERMNMGELVMQSVEQFRLMAECGGIRLSAHLDSRPMMLYGDHAKLMQTLNNLIHNAIKYTGDGGTIEVLAKSLPHEVLVSVIDTGAGIDKVQQQTIFERFRQAENRRNKAGSAGIGLNLAKRIVEMHSGRIWVESEPGRGSNFSFCVPVDALCDLSQSHKIAPLFKR